MHTFKLRRDLSTTWTRVNPILEEGEPAYERDTGKLKIGNGTTPWISLPYFTPRSGEIDPNLPAALIEHIQSTEPHPVYDDGPSLLLLYQNAKV